MRAVVQDRYGGPEMLVPQEVEAPSIGEADVLIRVRAASINAADTYLMRGRPYMLRAVFGWRKPRNRIPGKDVAGEVVSVGAKVTTLRPGDEVYGEINGAFAEYACAPERHLAPKPANLGFEQAAAVPMAGVTALQGLRDVGRLQAGQQVLINGASGGVGSFAVQIAKAMGAEVTGVCSAAKADMVRSIGADHVIDYQAEDFSQSGKRYDLIFDLAGRQSLSALRRALRPGGVALLSSGGGERPWTGPLGRLLGALVVSPFTGGGPRPLLATVKATDLVHLKELIEQGRIRPVVDRSYPLEEAAEAMRHFERRQVRGKVVITLGNDA